MSAPQAPSTPSPVALRYLEALAEPWELLGGAETLATPEGPLDVAGRAEVSGEIRTLIEAASWTGSEQDCLRLGHVALGALAEDYLVFLGPSGEVVDTPLQPLLAPGPRRRFHLRLLQAQRQGRLDRADDIERVMSEALDQPVRCMPDGLYTLDDAMSVIARRRPDLPTLASSARAVALFLGMTCMSASGRRYELSGKVVRVDLETWSGPLRIQAGEAARDALLGSEPGLLSSVLRSVSLLARDSGAWPEEVALPYVAWAPDPEGPITPDAEESVTPLMERRQDSVDCGLVPEFPELVRSWRCPGCSRIHEDLQVLVDFTPRTVEVALLRLRQAVAAVVHGALCRCGAALPFGALQAAVYCQYFPWPGVDLQIRVIRAEDGRLLESWSRTESGGSPQLLPGEPSGDILREHLGRRYTLAAEWAPLLEEADRSGELRAAPAGGLTWLLALPPGRPGDIARAVQEALAPARDWEARVLHLRDLPEHFRTGIPAVDGRIASGALGSAAVVDAGGLRARVLSELRNEGISVDPDEERPDLLHLQDLRLGASLDLAEELSHAVAAGRYPEDVVALAVRRARTAMRNVQRAVAEVERLTPKGTKLALDARSHVLRVSLPAQEPVELDLRRLLGPTGDDEGLERHVRYLLAPEVPRLDLCRCGEPAHLAVRLRSPEWLAGREGRLATVPGESPPHVYVRECPYHVRYLDWEALDGMGVPREGLERLRYRDLDRTGTSLRAVRLVGKAPFGILFVGEEAASLASHPALVAGACEAAGVQPPTMLEAISQDQNLLLACAPELPAPLRKVLQDRGQVLVGQATGGALPLSRTLLMGAIRGRIRVEELEEITVGG